MNVPNNTAIINGTAALKVAGVSSRGTIIEFPESRFSQSSNGRSVRSRMIRSMGEENYRNLMGAEITCSRIKIFAAGAFLFLGAVGTVLLEAFI